MLRENPADPQAANMAARMVVPGLLAACFGIALFGCAYHGSMTGDDPTPEKSRTEFALPAKFSRGLVLLRVGMDDLEPAWFVLDSAAESVVVSSVLAKKLDPSKSTVGPVEDISLYSADQRSVPATALATVDKLVIGRFHARSVEAVVAPLENLVSGLGLELEGVLPLGVFDGFCVTVDYPSKRVLLSAGDRLSVADSNTVVAVGTVPTVSVRISDQPMTAVIDTGSTAGICLPLRLERKFSYSELPQPSGSWTTVAGRTNELRSGTLAGNLVLAGQTVARPAVLLAPTARITIGSACLCRFVLVFDTVGELIQINSPVRHCGRRSDHE